MSDGIKMWVFQIVLTRQYFSRMLNQQRSDWNFLGAIGELCLLQSNVHKPQMVGDRKIHDYFWIEANLFLIFIFLLSRQ